MDEKKKCNTCKKKKIINKFHKDKSLKGGYRGQCKKCVKKQIKDVACTEKVKFKTCSICKRKKKSKEFYSDITKKNGLKVNCKDCGSKRMKEPEKRFSYAVKRAKERNIPFELNYEDYFSFIKKKCFYCRTRTYKIETGCGLDRIDNSRGYVNNNVVPCCGRCNKFRANFVPAVYFKKMMELYLKLQQSDLGMKVKKKKKTKKVILDAKKIKKANQLSKRYTNMKRKWFKSKVMRPISPNTNDFSHLLKAVDIINRHDVTIKTFMKAQIAGLSYIKDGKGIFPNVTHLSTNAAETRLLEYEREKNLEIELTDKEIKTELQSNKKYMKYHDKVNDGTATMMQAVYVRECQLARRNDVQPVVEKYITKLKKEI